MKKMFYAVAVIAAMTVCSCGNKAQTTETDVVEGEAIEIITPDSTCCKEKSACCGDSTACSGDSCASATPCAKCQKAAE